MVRAPVFSGSCHGRAPFHLVHHLEVRRHGTLAPQVISRLRWTVGRVEHPAFLLQKGASAPLLFFFPPLQCNHPLRGRRYAPKQHRSLRSLLRRAHYVRSLAAVVLGRHAPLIAFPLCFHCLHVRLCLRVVAWLSFSPMLPPFAHACLVHLIPKVDLACTCACVLRRCHAPS